MAQTFNRFVTKDIGNSLTDICTAVTNTSVVVGLLISNPTGTGDVTVDIVFHTSTDEIMIGNDLVIPYGQSLIVIGWDQKIVMKAGDKIRVQTTVGGKVVDSILSVMEIS